MERIKTATIAVLAGILAYICIAGFQGQAKRVERIDFSMNPTAPEQLGNKGDGIEKLLLLLKQGYHVEVTYTERIGSADWFNIVLVK